MILPELILTNRIGQCWDFTGLDQLDQCKDKVHFKSYPYSIQYKYNSRGFRDQEWPIGIEDLKTAIWCIGDSFTVGLGSPIQHTWPYQLSSIAQQRVINVSMDGASNEWIARMVQHIVHDITPKNIVIMWSYVHRRELADTLLGNEDRRKHFVKSSNEEDWQNFLNCKARVDSITKSTQFAIPGFSPDILDLEKCWESIRGFAWPTLVPGTLSELSQLPQWILSEMDVLHNCLHQFQNTLMLKENLGVTSVKKQDLARDGAHFDLVTAGWVAQQAMSEMDL
jgi:hypothetical protein